MPDALLEPLLEAAGAGSSVAPAAPCQLWVPLCTLVGARPLLCGRLGALKRCSKQRKPSPRF